MTCSGFIDTSACPQMIWNGPLPHHDAASTMLHDEDGLQTPLSLDLITLLCFVFHEPSGCLRYHVVVCLCSSFLSFSMWLKHFVCCPCSSTRLWIRSTGACCRCATRWSTASWRTGTTWRGSGSTFTPRSSCRPSPRRWAHWRVDARFRGAIREPVTLTFCFFCSILCCWPRLLSTPARTERKPQRSSSRPSTSLRSSSPCRQCWACKISHFFLFNELFHVLRFYFQPRHEVCPPSGLPAETVRSLFVTSLLTKQCIQTVCGERCVCDVVWQSPTLCHKQNLNNHRGMIMHRTYQQIKTELMIYKNSFTVHTHEVGLGDITIATWLIYFSIDYWSVLFFHFFCGLVQRGNRPPTQVNEPWIHLNLFLNPLQCQT